MKIFTIIFGGPGILLLAIAGVLYPGGAKFLERAEMTSGRVIDLY